MDIVIIQRISLLTLLHYVSNALLMVVSHAHHSQPALFAIKPKTTISKPQPAHSATPPSTTSSLPTPQEHTANSVLSQIAFNVNP